MMKQNSVIDDILRVSEMCDNNIQAAEKLANSIISRLKEVDSKISSEDLRIINVYLQKSMSDLRATQLDVKKKLDKNKESSKLSSIYHAIKHN